MVRLEIRSPADYGDCLEVAGQTRWFRQAAMMMRLRSRTWSFHADGVLLAVAYLWPHPDGTGEFCLAAMPSARSHMLALCRYAQLTLQQIAQTGTVVFCHVKPGHVPGERMARLTGFLPDPETKGKWVHVWRLGYGKGADRIVRGWFETRQFRSC